MSFLQVAPELLGLDALDYYLKDDWEDNSLVDRSATESGLYGTPRTNEAGDILIGRDRPEWRIRSGSPTVDSGRLAYSSGSTPWISTISNIAYGSWSYDYEETSIGGQNSYFDFISTQTASFRSECYEHILDLGSNQSVLVLRSGGNTNQLINAGATNNSRYKITRDAYGNFEMLDDASALGTATDTTISTSMSMRFGSGSVSGTDFKIDNLVVK